MTLLKTLSLFVATALAEIVGCFLPYLWLKQDKTAWLLALARSSPWPSCNRGLAAEALFPD
jgi:small multidrug resistance family-3 protein